MDISVTRFKQHCLDIVRRVERTGKPVSVTRRGKVVARLHPASAGPAARGQQPWQRLRAAGGQLRARPGESVLNSKDFEASR